MKKSFDFETIKRNCKHFEIFHSVDDSYVPLEKGEEVAEKVGGIFHKYTDKGHFTSDSGCETFPDLANAIRENL